MQAGKAAMTALCRQIAAAHLPRGWTHRPIKRLRGLCSHADRIITAPRPVTRRALQVFLHECGHAMLHERSSKPRWVEEIEAETYALVRMAAAGLVDAGLLREAEEYICGTIARARRHRARISPDVEVLALENFRKEVRRNHRGASR